MTDTAIVTGAARGIGRAVADRLEGQGWAVARLDLDPGQGEVFCDVSDEGSVAAAFRQMGDFLEPGLKLLVNNAGIAGAVSGPVEKLALADWNGWIGTNLTGPFLMARAAIPHLRKVRGSIVNITSTRAAMSEPDTEAYAASKGGLAALTHALAISLGPDVRVNAVAPGWIHTGQQALRPEDHGQHPAGRVGRPVDVADAVLYLSEASFVTGETLTVDGGMTRKMIYEA
jgi:NAD(P)-dependent dehydrogenase (short-subunit alcohol dehydrogenase family)